MSNTIFAAVTFNADRTTRTYWGELAGNDQVFTGTDPINPNDPNAVNHALLAILMPTLSLVQRKPTRVILESQEQVYTFQQWAATLFPEHRLSWLLAKTPVTFSVAEKTEKKAFMAVRHKAQNALEEHIQRRNQKAEQAAAIEQEAVRRLAEQKKLEAEREATLAARHAAIEAEQNTRNSARLAEEQAQVQQRAFDAQVRARMAQIAGAR